MYVEDFEKTGLIPCWFSPHWGVLNSWVECEGVGSFIGLARDVNWRGSGTGRWAPGTLTYDEVFLSPPQNAKGCKLTFLECLKLLLHYGFCMFLHIMLFDDVYCRIKFDVVSSIFTFTYSGSGEKFHPMDVFEVCGWSWSLWPLGYDCHGRWQIIATSRDLISKSS